MALPVTVSAIEKGVPMPATPRGKLKKYPLADMEVGDSFMVSCEDAQRRRVDKVVRGVVMYAERKTLAGCKFTVRTVDGGMRVWRVA